VECGVHGGVGCVAVWEAGSRGGGGGGEVEVVEYGGGVVVEECFAGGGVVGSREGGPVHGEEGFVVCGGEAEFDGFVELLGRGEVDAEFEAGFWVLVVAG